MENSTKSPKKKWAMPDFYLLDSVIEAKSFGSREQYFNKSVPFNGSYKFYHNNVLVGTDPHPLKSINS